MLTAARRRIRISPGNHKATEELGAVTLKRDVDDASTSLEDLLQTAQVSEIVR